MMKSLRGLSLLAMAAAGVLHLLAAPQHMTHMTVHGLALLGFGVLQLAWVVVVGAGGRGSPYWQELPCQLV